MLVQESFDRAILGAGYQVILDMPCLIPFQLLHLQLRLAAQLVADVTLALS